MIKFEPEEIPLREDEHGVLRMGSTRVTLDSIVYAFQAGSTPESIVEQFSTVPLADIYLVLAFYLKHTDMVDEYLRHQQKKADEIQREVESRFPPHGIRERLLARRLKSASA